MKIIYTIIDNVSSDVQDLKALLIMISAELGCGYEITNCSCPEAALTAILTEQGLQIIFVDAVLPGISGMELIPLLRKQHGRALFVLMSSRRSHMKDGYTVEAFDFLQKPFVKEDVSAVIQRAVRKAKDSQHEQLLLYADKSYFRINYSDILTISVEKNYAVLSALSRNYCFRSTVKRLMEKLPGQFVQISRYTIVNVLYVTELAPEQVVLGENGMILGVAKQYYKHLADVFTELR